MKRFENKVVAITGGGSGMGRVSSELFAQEGATVCVVDINGAAAQQTVDSILAAGGKAKAYTLDITDAPAMEAFFKDVVDTFGRIDVYFTIAGISPMGTAVTTSVEDFRKVVALDMESVFLGCKYSIPYMEKQGGGVILNLAGTYGIRPTPNKLGYSAAKAGALSITRSVAIDFARSNIRCNAICPGFVNTPLNNGFEGEARQRFLDTYQPAPFEIQARDIAETALFLASDEARAITGQAIVVDGGTEASLYLNYKRAK